MRKFLSMLVVGLALAGLGVSPAMAGNKAAKPQASHKKLVHKEQKHLAHKAKKHLAHKAQKQAAKKTHHR